MNNRNILRIILFFYKNSRDILLNIIQFLRMFNNKISFKKVYIFLIIYYYEHISKIFIFISVFIFVLTQFFSL